MSTQEIRDIYKKIQITKTQTSDRLKKELEENLTTKLNRTVGKYMALLQNPKVSAGEMDEAKRQMSKMLEILQMDSDEGVIVALTNIELTKKFKEGLK